MVQIVKLCPICIKGAKRIPWKHVAAVIADGLDRRQRAKDHTLPDRESSKSVPHHETEDIEEETFEPVSVYGTVCVGDVEAVVLGVNDTCAVGFGWQLSQGTKLDVGIGSGEGKSYGRASGLCGRVDV